MCDTSFKYLSLYWQLQMGVMQNICDYALTRAAETSFQPSVEMKNTQLEVENNKQ